MQGAGCRVSGVGCKTSSLATSPPSPCLPPSLPPLRLRASLVPGKGNSNSHGARPVHLIVKMIKWIRTSRLSIKNSLSPPREGVFRWRTTQKFPTNPSTLGQKAPSRATRFVPVTSEAPFPPSRPNTETRTLTAETKNILGYGNENYYTVGSY